MLPKPFYYFRPCRRDFKAHNGRNGQGCNHAGRQGAYTGNEKNVILCVIRRTQITQLKDLINEIDPKAFVLVADVREVMGEGF